MGILFCFVAAVAFCGLGLGGLLAPAPLATAFGIPTEDAGGLRFVCATAARDLAFGIAIALLAGMGERRALIVLMLAGLVIPLSDLRLVRAHRGKTRAQVVHALGALAMLATAAVLRYESGS